MSWAAARRAATGRLAGKTCRLFPPLRFSTCDARHNSAYLFVSAVDIVNLIKGSA